MLTTFLIAAANYFVITEVKLWKTRTREIISNTGKQERKKERRIAEDLKVLTWSWEDRRRRSRELVASQTCPSINEARQGSEGSEEFI